MESLSNFNFLKVTDVKKNNESNASDKKLAGSDKSFVINKTESIENKFNNKLGNELLTEELLLKEKKENKKFKKKLNIENPDILFSDINIKNNENNIENHLDFVSSAKLKENNIPLNLSKDSSLNNNFINKPEKVFNQNIDKLSKKNVINNDLENNMLNKLRSGNENIKDNKIKSETQITFNHEKKSKLKSFFQNYFNYKLKKYTKKNISLKKSHPENFINNDRKSYKEAVNFLSNNTTRLNENSNVINEQKNNVNSENTAKEQNSFNDSYTKNSTEKNISHARENTLDNFDRLKNILDLRTNDIKQRFSQILENNIKMNNNKFEIQLRPENLGKIQITLEITGQNVDININSDNINAIQSLTENNSNLQKMLQNHGMNLTNFNFNGNNNNKGFGKNSQKSEGLKDKDISVNTKENNDDDNSHINNKLVYVKA